MVPEWYQIAKDFQPITAALFVVGAAIIAYFSAQHVSKRQLKTAEQQEIRDRLQKRMALTILLGEKIDLIGLVVTMRKFTVSSLANSTDESGAARDHVCESAYPVILRELGDWQPLSQEVPFSEFVWQDLALLTPPAQLLLYQLQGYIQSDDHRLLRIKRGFELDRVAWVPELKSLADDLERILHKTKEARDMLDELLDQLTAIHQTVTKNSIKRRRWWN